MPPRTRPTTLTHQQVTRAGQPPNLTDDGREDPGVSMCARRGGRVPPPRADRGGLDPRSCGYGRGRARSFYDSAGRNSGSSTAKGRTGPGPVCAVSNRTVTRPSPEPHTQPRRARRGPHRHPGRSAVRLPQAPPARLGLPPAEARPVRRGGRSARGVEGPSGGPPSASGSHTGRSGRACRNRRLEQGLLGQFRQPGHAHPEQPQPARHVDAVEQGGRPPRSRRRCRWWRRPGSGSASAWWESG